MFATRKNHDLWVFGDALAKAQRAWRAVQYEPEPEDANDLGMLFVSGRVIEPIEDDRQNRGIAAITANLEELPARCSAFKLVDHFT